MKHPDNPNFEIADRYIGRPKPEKVEKVIRKCLNLSCQREFVAKGRFIRLCEFHREQS